MVLDLKAIQKSFRTNEGEVPVLSDISLSLLAGETLALRGESGSVRVPFCTLREH